jgi:branched-subunit amino acid transport protein
MNYLLLILGMAAVTYLPRLLPMAFLPRKKLPKRLRHFLSCIPFAALGALIIPDGLDAIPGEPLLSGLGLAAALITAFFFRSLLIPMIASVVTVLGLSYVF